MALTNGTSAVIPSLLVFPIGQTPLASLLKEIAAATYQIYLKDPIVFICVAANLTILVHVLSILFCSVCLS